MSGLKQSAARQNDNKESRLFETTEWLTGISVLVGAAFIITTFFYATFLTRNEGEQIINRLERIEQKIDELLLQ